MKKSFMLFIGLFAMSMASFALPNSSVLLQHQGNVTVYPLESLNDALDAAVDGDTLFLSKGTYPGFTIRKKITVRGAGVSETTVTGNVAISIPDSVTLTNTLLEGLNIYTSVGNRYNIVVTKSVNGLKIKQCRFRGIKFNGHLRDVLIDRCNIFDTFFIPNNNDDAVKSVTVKNSYVYRLDISDETTKDISFVNCNVYTFSGSSYSYFRGSFINSILSGGSDEFTLKSMLLINTLINNYNLDGTIYTEKYYQEDKELIDLSNNGTCIYSDEELLEKGYVGNDGTVVGFNGGSTPYTLTLAVPAVTSSDVKLDADQRKLNVNLTLSAE